MTPQLIRQITEYEYLKEHLKAEYREIDEETLRDTLEGISSLPDVLAAMVRSYLGDLALAAALGIRIGDMQERLARIEARADKKRAEVAGAMERADFKKLSEPDFTVSLRATPRQLIVQDESQIPGAFWTPQPPKLDRRRLATALAGDASVPGACLGNGGMTISVRTK